MNVGRRFSQAVSEGDGISLIALVTDADDAAHVADETADAVYVSPAHAELVSAVRAQTSLPLVAEWPGNLPANLSGVDAYLLPVDAEREWVAQRYDELREKLEIAFYIEDEEHLETALEEFDPEIFVLAAPDADGEEALERVLDLLPDVPAGKLAIAELAGSERTEVEALERAGFDGVIVEPQRLPDLTPDEPPEV
jgi:NAD(P)H-dependent flavin oxidoreductase YrpB (nitropropane dioxygenase family)